MIKFSESQKKIIKGTDYTADGKSPILKETELSLDSTERNGLLLGETKVNEHGEPLLMPLSEEKLLIILQKCKNYELNVQKYKVDLKYIK